MSITVIGFDPGVSTGVAIYINGNLVKLKTVRVDEYHELLFDVGGPLFVVIEDSRKQSHVFTGPRVTGAAKSKIARNIGMIDGFCHVLQTLCETCAIPFVLVSPEQKGRKLDDETFKRITGYQGRSNQHERDAAMVARPFRNHRGH